MCGFAKQDATFMKFCLTMGLNLLEVAIEFLRITCFSDTLTVSTINISPLT